MLFFVGVEDVRFGDGLFALVLDAPDNGALHHMEDDDFTVGIIRIGLHFQRDVLEKLRVPESAEVPLERIDAVGVADPRKNSRQQRITLDAAVSLEKYLGDDVLPAALALLRVLRADGPQDRKKEQAYDHRNSGCARKYESGCGRSSSQGRSPRPKW